MPLYGCEVAGGRAVYDANAEHIVFEDCVSRRQQRRGVHNLSPARVAKWAVRRPGDMAKKASHERLCVAYILPCDIEPALIVRCDAIEMRDLDVDPAILKVVLRPTRGRL